MLSVHAYTLLWDKAGLCHFDTWICMFRLLSRKQSKSQTESTAGLQLYESCAFRQLSWRRIGLMHFIAYQYDGRWLEQSTVSNSNALILAMTDDRRVKIKLHDNKRCRALLLLIVGRLMKKSCIWWYKHQNRHDDSIRYTEQICPTPPKNPRWRPFFKMAAIRSSR